MLQQASTPQSASVSSSPFFTESKQLEGLHVPPSAAGVEYIDGVNIVFGRTVLSYAFLNTHTRSRQSSPLKHARPVEQPDGQPPPQSVPVSQLFCRPSLQRATSQL